MDAPSTTTRRLAGNNQQPTMKKKAIQESSASVGRNGEGKNSETRSRNMCGGGKMLVVDRKQQSSGQKSGKLWHTPLVDLSDAGLQRSTSALCSMGTGNSTTLLSTLSKTDTAGMTYGRTLGTITIKEETDNVPAPLPPAPATLAPAPMIIAPIAPAPMPPAPPVQIVPKKRRIIAALGSEITTSSVDTTKTITAPRTTQNITTARNPQCTHTPITYHCEPADISVLNFGCIRPYPTVNDLQRGRENSKQKSPLDLSKKRKLQTDEPLDLSLRQESNTSTAATNDLSQKSKLATSEKNRKRRRKGLEDVVRSLQSTEIEVDKSVRTAGTKKAEDFKPSVERAAEGLSKGHVNDSNLLTGRESTQVSCTISGKGSGHTNTEVDIVKEVSVSDHQKLLENVANSPILVSVPSKSNNILSDLDTTQSELNQDDNNSACNVNQKQAENEKTRDMYLRMIEPMKDFAGELVLRMKDPKMTVEEMSAGFGDLLKRVAGLAKSSVSDGCLGDKSGGNDRKGIETQNVENVVDDEVSDVCDASSKNMETESGTYVKKSASSSSSVKEVSNAIEEVSHKVNEVSHNVSEKSHYVDEVSDDLEDEASHDFTQVSHDVTQVSHDVTQVSHDVTQVSHDVTQVSHDVTKVTCMANDVNRVSHIVDELSHSVKEVSSNAKSGPSEGILGDQRHDDETNQEKHCKANKLKRRGRRPKKRKNSSSKVNVSPKQGSVQSVNTDEIDKEQCEKSQVRNEASNESSRRIVVRIKTRKSGLGESVVEVRDVGRRVTRSSKESDNRDRRLFDVEICEKNQGRDGKHGEKRDCEEGGGKEMQVCENDEVSESAHKGEMEERMDRRKGEKEKIDSRKVDKRTDGRRVEKERIDGRKVEKERIDGRKVEKERIDGRKVEKERSDGRKAEKERIDGRKAEERIDGRKVEKERSDGRQVEKEKINERKAEERIDGRKVEKERSDGRQVEKERIDGRKAEERIDGRKVEKERSDGRQVEKEKIDGRKAEERIDGRKVDKRIDGRKVEERINRRKVEKERMDGRKVEKERIDRRKVEERIDIMKLTQDIDDTERRQVDQSSDDDALNEPLEPIAELEGSAQLNDVDVDSSKSSKKTDKNGNENVVKTKLKSPKTRKVGRPKKSARKKKTDKKEKSTKGEKKEVDENQNLSDFSTITTKSEREMKPESTRTLIKLEDNSDKKSDSLLRFYCCVCAKRWPSGGALRKHLKYHKGWEKFIFCRTCSEYFSRQEDCDAHQSVHKIVHKCDACQKVFKNRSTLQHHSSSHMTERPFVCDLCAKTFKTEKVLRDHKRYGHPPEHYKFVCSMCEREYKNRSSLREHMQRCAQGDTRPHHCTECNARFKSKSSLCAHIRHVHRKEKKHVCPVCGMMFARRQMVDSHMMTHTGERPFGCEQCDKRFSKKTTLTRHMRSHTGERPYVCSVCNKSYQRHFSLAEHKRIHTGEMPYQCVICDRRFRQHIRYKRHLRLHTGERPYACTHCQKTFVDKDCLSSHLKIHSEVRAYKCRVCGRGFKWSSSLHNHQRIHTGSKPYTCDVCGKAFRQSQTLKVHQRIHTGERPYQCPVCPRTFRDNSDFYHHKKSHNRAKPYKCPYCIKRFSRPDTVTAHVKSVHEDAGAGGGTGLLECHDCGKKFTALANLRNHLRNHTGEAPFACRMCGKRYKHRAPWHYHMGKCGGGVGNNVAETKCGEEETEGKIEAKIETEGN